jgi:hypothetical protein
VTWQAWVLAAIGAIGGITGLTSLLLVPSQRRKARADAAAVVVDSAIDLLGPLREEVRELKGELVKVERLVRLIRRELERPSPSVERLRDIVGLDADV